jgi:hypothetical protein
VRVWAQRPVRGGQAEQNGPAFPRLGAPSWTSSSGLASGRIDWKSPHVAHTPERAPTEAEGTRQRGAFHCGRKAFWRGASKVLHGMGAGLMPLSRL